MPRWASGPSAAPPTEQREPSREPSDAWKLLRVRRRRVSPPDMKYAEGVDACHVFRGIRCTAVARRPMPPVVRRLGWVSFFTDTAGELLYPLIPIFLTVTLGAPVAALGLIEGLADGVSTGLRAISGALADRSPPNRPLTTISY